MGNTLEALAAARGAMWAAQMLDQMSDNVRWPSDTRILSRLAWLEVADLGGGAKLIEAWIGAAERRWTETRRMAA